MGKILEFNRNVKHTPHDFFHVGDLVRLKTISNLKVTGIVMKCSSTTSVYIKWPSGSFTSESIDSLIKVEE
jgi:hypothetical protein